jgi:hypothetical protein
LPIEIVSKEPIVCIGVPYRNYTLNLYVESYSEECYISAYTDSKKRIVSDLSNAVQLHQAYYYYGVQDYGYGHVEESCDTKNVPWIIEELQDIVSIIGPKVFFSLLE